jgi:uncharacterized surface protein with fasciclin (FAS1) repeats
MLRSGAEYTLIVPTDKCFKDVSKTMRTKMADNCYLRKLLSYHISKKEKSSTTIGVPSKDLKSVSQGKYIFFSKLGQMSMYGGSLIQKPNIRSSNGDVIIVDNFMTVPQQTVLQVLTSARKYTTLTQALQQPALAQQLNTLGPYTIFAPPDDSLTQKHTQTVQTLLQDHIVKGVYFSQLFRGGNRVTLKSVSGKDIVVVKQGDSCSVNGVMVQQLDIRATNGVIHVMKQAITK